MIKLFEVTVAFAAGYYLPILMAETTPELAIYTVHRRLRELGVSATGERLGPGQYEKEDSVAREVNVDYVNATGVSSTP